MTDDRGEYRINCVPPGHYLVSVGVGYELARTPGKRGDIFKQTFRPGVIDQSKAIAINVEEGLESSGVDITVGPPMKTYTINGRISEADGTPLPQIQLSIITIGEDRQVKSTTSGPWSSDGNGEFSVEGALPGHYEIAPYNDPSSNSFGEPIAVDVKDEDVSGLVIKMSRGSSISGIVVVEGDRDTILPDNLSDLGIIAYVNPLSKDSGITTSSSKISSDGSFRISGLCPGRAMIYPSPSSAKGFVILRIENNGIEQHDGIVVGPGEQITGLHVVIGTANGVIRGVDK